MQLAVYARYMYVPLSKGFEAYLLVYQRRQTQKSIEYYLPSVTSRHLHMHLYIPPK